ncbi:hypothetical protein [Roseivirga sp.]|uniref:hypothetical protein n=1 Tax=Roseivirga sp. TaxID=1964215 RepID=UPI002B27A26F|nr:hypothetical protein [Roseivirga sp.]
MKNTVLLICILICGISSSTYAQETEEINSNWGLGFHIKQNQQDFGLGVNMTSPYFAQKKVALRVRANLLFNEHINNTNITTWTPYSSMSLGIIGVAGKIGEFIRLYSEGGLTLLLPSSEFSSESTVLGGYGLFGFEFFMHQSANYFIEIGGVGTGASADKIVGNPIYSNGLMINVGYRYVFK